MEENNQNQNSVNADEIKNQTVNTAKQVKETIKNVNIKEETKVATDTLVNMYKDPIGTVEAVAEDKENKFFKTALFLIIVWAISNLLQRFFYGMKMKGIYKKDLGYVFEEYIFKLKTIWAILIPAIIIIAYSIIVYVLNKNNKKQIPEVASVVSVAFLPTILGNIITLIEYLSSKINQITTPVVSILNVVTIILLYFGLKKVFNENDDKKFIKTFVVITALYAVVTFVFNLLDVNILWF